MQTNREVVLRAENVKKYFPIRGTLGRVVNNVKAVDGVSFRIARGKTLGIVALGVCAVIFVIGFLSGMPLMEIFMTAVSLAVAAIPEGLPAIVAIVLAMTGILDPVVGALVHNAGSVLVIVNSSLLLKWRKRA